MKSASRHRAQYACVVRNAIAASGSTLAGSSSISYSSRVTAPSRLPANVIVHFVNTLVQYRLSGRTAREISASVEAAIRSRDLAPGDQLPPVRALAAHLRVTPATLRAAYR